MWHSSHVITSFLFLRSKNVMFFVLKSVSLSLIMFWFALSNWTRQILCTVPGIVRSKVKVSYDKIFVHVEGHCKYIYISGLRLLGIGRNQYIDLMNQCRSSKVSTQHKTNPCHCHLKSDLVTFSSVFFLPQKFFRRKPPKDLLPAQPIETVTFEYWWLVNVGYITEEDVKVI